MTWIRAFVAVTLSNFVLMPPVGLLYILSSYLLAQQLLKKNLRSLLLKLLLS